MELVLKQICFLVLLSSVNKTTTWKRSDYVTEIQLKILEMVKTCVAASLEESAIKPIENFELHLQGTIEEMVPKTAILIPEYIYGKSDIIALIEREQKEKCIALIYESLPFYKLQSNHNYSLQNTAACFRAMEILENVETIWLVSPGIQLLKSLISFSDDKNMFVKMMLDMLLNGKDTKLAVTHSLTKNNLVKEEYESLLQKVIQIGFRVEYLVQKASTEDKVFQKELLLEKDVEMAKQMGKNTLTVAAKCIVTPLAKDKAKESGIDIILIR